MGNCCCSNFIIDLIKRTHPEDALKNTFIIKQIVLGISNFTDKKLIAKIIGIEKKNYVHASLFISNLDNEKFEDKGLLLEFGKYESKNNQNGLMKYEYANGGMRYGFCTLTEYKKKLANSISLNLELQQPLFLFKDLIENLKDNNDSWDLNAFDYKNHNCQHFCAKVIRILNAKYNPNNISINDCESLLKGNKIDILPDPIKEVFDLNKNPH